MSAEEFRKRARHPRRAAPIVHTDGDRRVLMFADAVVQSEMLLSAPDELVLADYGSHTGNDSYFGQST